jgi:uncharacterized membrane protein YfcA
MNITIIILLILTGILVGFINTLSAGGTTISIALYLAMGIPPQVTNAINRVGVLIQNGFACAMFYRKHIINYRHIVLYSIPILIGTFIGSVTAVNIDESVFNVCFAIVLLVITVFLFIKHKDSGADEKPFTLKRYFICSPFFLIAGFYGGFVQAGTGFLLIVISGTLLGYNLIKTTAAKNTFMFIYTVVAMSVFVFRGGVEPKYWIYALIHSVGNIIGSYIAAKYAIKKGNLFIKIVIVCVIILTALNLLNVIDIKVFIKNIIK